MREKTNNNKTKANQENEFWHPAVCVSIPLACDVAFYYEKGIDFCKKSSTKMIKKSDKLIEEKMLFNQEHESGEDNQCGARSVNGSAGWTSVTAEDTPFAAADDTT
ncbi:hypothetical protein DPMN_094935 [Dreissena polymorpha]|uniref:Uncharacterized protein n=1 Tax=Dreissena polymorpha TaxID=45954 RepID=A0A9D4L6F4_DREPO|nr:hypothetical protein DPMN_094935 [Dreissena polymorpha]